MLGNPSPPLGSHLPLAKGHPETVSSSESGNGSCKHASTRLHPGCSDRNMVLVPRAVFHGNVDIFQPPQDSSFKKCFFIYCGHQEMSLVSGRCQVPVPVICQQCRGSQGSGASLCVAQTVR
jgi:hypothetical protein